MSDSIQIKLKHIAITAEELLAELRGRGGGIAVTGDLADVANSLPGPLHYGMQQEIGRKETRIKVLEVANDSLTQYSQNLTRERDRLREELSTVTAERDELRRHLGKVMSEREKQKKLIDKVIDERDALRARIDAGVVVYGRECTTPECFVWGPLQLDKDTHTALIIDRQPIEHDERKGERRKGKERVYLSELGPRGKYFDGYRNGRYVYGAADIRKNDRRRKDGTRADREESK